MMMASSNLNGSSSSGASGGGAMNMNMEGRSLAYHSVPLSSLSPSSIMTNTPTNSIASQSLSSMNRDASHLHIYNNIAGTAPLMNVPSSSSMPSRALDNNNNSNGNNNNNIYVSNGYDIRSSLPLPMIDHSNQQALASSLSSSLRHVAAVNNGNADNGGDGMEFVTTLVSLSGVYDGRSTPHNGEQATDWTDCIITFASNCKLQGNGQSVWRGEIITFRLVGSIDPITRSFELYKTHTGKFTNTIVYNGIIDMAAARLDGSYRTGRLTLTRRTHDNIRNIDSSSLSSIASSVSSAPISSIFAANINRTNHYATATAVPSVGGISGVHLASIPSLSSGHASIASQQYQHDAYGHGHLSHSHGQSHSYSYGYNNGNHSNNGHGNMYQSNTSASSASGAGCVVPYVASGLLTSGASLASPSVAPLASQPLLSHTSASLSSSSPSSSSVSSMMVSVIHPSSSSSSPHSIYANNDPRYGTPLIQSWHPSSSLSSSSPAAAPPHLPLASRYDHHPDGKQDNSATSGSLSLSSSQANRSPRSLAALSSYAPYNSSVSSSGRFSSVDSVLAAANAISLATPATAASLSLSQLQSSERAEGQTILHVGGLALALPSSSISSSSSSSSSSSGAYDQMMADKNAAVMNTVPSATMAHTNMTTITTTSSSSSSVSAWMSSSHDGEGEGEGGRSILSVPSSSSQSHIITPSSGNGYGHNNNNGGGYGMFASSALAGSTDEKLERYQLFLGGMIVGTNQLSSRQQEALARFRSQHSITIDEHYRVLSLLGISEMSVSDEGQSAVSAITATYGSPLSVTTIHTPTHIHTDHGGHTSVLSGTHASTYGGLTLSSSYGGMIGSGSSTNSGGSAAGAADDNLCKVCFDKAIDCVILPCAHMCICSLCSKLLSKCPVCRATIIEAKTVYRS